VTVDQLSFSHPDPSLRASTVPMIDNPRPYTIKLGVGFCPSFMVTFDYPPPFGDVKLISATPDHPGLKYFKCHNFKQLNFTIHRLFLPHRL
jgi:hypothetical protein